MIDILKLCKISRIPQIHELNFPWKICWKCPEIYQPFATLWLTHSLSPTCAHICMESCLFWGVTQEGTGPYVCANVCGEVVLTTQQWFYLFIFKFSFYNCLFFLSVLLAQGLGHSLKTETLYIGKYLSHIHTNTWNLTHNSKFKS